MGKNEEVKKDSRIIKEVKRWKKENTNYEEDVEGKQSQ